jgi:hypothetical protein
MAMSAKLDVYYPSLWTFCEFKGELLAWEYNPPTIELRARISNCRPAETRSCGQKLDSGAGYCKSTIMEATWTKAKKLRAVFS